MTYETRESECALKVANGADKCYVAAANSNAGQSQVNMIWRFVIRTAQTLKPSLFRMGYMLRNMRNALVAIVSACSFHVRFLSKLTPRYFTWLVNGICLHFNVGEASTAMRRWEK
jgi:hypothetical protein